MSKIKPKIYYERAERLKSVRLLANLKRDEFAHLAEVSPTTVSFWENVTHTGLTEDGAIKTVAALEKSGIICTVPWLMFGTGDTPYKQGEKQNIGLYAHHQTAEGMVNKEVSLFQHQANTVILTVQDDAMSPIFLKQDIVGGIWQDINKINISERLTCIIEFNNNLLVRKIRTAQLNSYDLYALCFDPNAIAPYEIKGISLSRIAPIYRLWRNH